MTVRIVILHMHTDKNMQCFTRRLVLLFQIMCTVELSALPLLFVCQSATITITQLLPGRLTPFHTRPRHCGSPRLPPASPDGGDPHNTRGATSPSSPFLQSSHATSWLWWRLSRGSVVVFSTNKEGQRHDFHITSKRDIHSPAPDLVAVMNSGIRGHYFIRSGSSIGRANYTGAHWRRDLLQVTEAAAHLVLDNPTSAIPSVLLGICISVSVVCEGLDYLFEHHLCSQC